MSHLVCLIRPMLSVADCFYVRCEAREPENKRLASVLRALGERARVRRVRSEILKVLRVLGSIVSPHTPAVNSTFQPAFKGSTHSFSLYTRLRPVTTIFDSASIEFFSSASIEFEV